MYRKKEIRLILILQLVMFVFIATACGSAKNSSDSAKSSVGVSEANSSVEMDSETEVAKQDSPADYGQSMNQDQTNGDNKGTKSSNPIQTRMVIYNATLTLQVKDYQNVQSAISQGVEAKGGYIVESSTYKDGGNGVSGRIIVKIPQPSFNTFLTELEELSIEVRDRSVIGNDVTEEYVDLEARLKSKIAVEARLTSFMEKATTTEDLLKISSDLASVQQEIEQVRGRMKYLQNNTDFSTVTISLYENTIDIPKLQTDEKLDTWTNAKKTFMNTINFLMLVVSKLIVFLIGFSPILIGLGAIGGVILWLKKRYGNNNQSL